MKTLTDYIQQPINEATTGTASNIEVKRWVTETKMRSNKYPVYAVFIDGDTVKHFAISGCTHDGEIMELKLEEKK